MPLLHDGSVIGVTQIGSTRSDDFSDVEKRLARAVAERAAWAVAQRFRVDRFHEVLMSAPAIVSIVRGPDFECEFSNLAHRALFGGRDVIGVPASSLGATPEILSMFERARATGQTVAASEYPISCDWRGDGKPERRFFNFTAEPLRGPTGKIEELLWFAIDVTDQVLTREAVEKASRERARLLESERTARDRRRDREPREGRLPGDGVPRAPDAAQRHPRVDRRRPAPGAQGARASARHHRAQRPRADAHHRGRPRRLAHRRRQAPARHRRRPTSRRPSKGALETVRPEAEARGVVLSADVGAVGIIAADAGRLQQVVWNVLSNAIKFTPEGGTVDLAAARLGQRIVIRVTDTGEGIDAAFLPHLFEPFRQADGSTTRRHGGLGLGLAIVKQLVQAHGGTIRAESEGPTLRLHVHHRAPGSAVPARVQDDHERRADGPDSRAAARRPSSRSAQAPRGRRRGGRALAPRRDPLGVRGAS